MITSARHTLSINSMAIIPIAIQNIANPHIFLIKPLRFSAIKPLVTRLFLIARRNKYVSYKYVYAVCCHFVHKKTARCDEIKSTTSDSFLLLQFVLCAFNASGPHTCSADIQLFRSAVHFAPYMLNIRLKFFIGSSMRMAHFVTEKDAFSAD